MKPALLLHIFLCLFVYTTSFSQTPPTNNNPNDATALTVGAGVCSGNTSGTLVDATNSGIATPSCGEGIGSDVWYTAVVPASGNLVIETYKAGNTSINTVLTVYSKDASDNYTEVGCDDDGGKDNFSNLVLTDQIASATLYIRVWGKNQMQQPFEVCAWEPTAVAGNDSPDTATALPVGSVSCSTRVSGSTVAATNSKITAPSCGSGLSSDLWYTVVVPGSGRLIIETYNRLGYLFDTVLTAYTKDGAGNYTEIACDDNGRRTDLSRLKLAGLTAGNTLYIRVWGNDQARGSFELCAWEPATVISNDTPKNPFALNLGSGSCASKVVVDTENAHDSGVGVPSCVEDTSVLDAWYAVVVPASGSFVVETSNIAAPDGERFDNNDLEINDPSLAVYTKAGATYTEIGCANRGALTSSGAALTVTGQTPGSICYIRTWAFNQNIRRPTGRFELCAWEPTTVAANDTPDAAIALTVGTGACSNTSGTTATAGKSAVENPNCGTGLTRDVWYTAVVPSSGNLNIESSRVSTVYTKDGSGNYTEIACNTSGELFLTGQAVGTTLYIRIWGNNEAHGSFRVCAWEPTGFVANNDPTAATALTVGSGSCSDQMAGATTAATLSAVAAPSCDTGITSDVWYTAVVPASGNLRVETSGDVLAAYTKDNSNNYTEIGCDSTLILTNQTPNETLYFRVGTQSRGSFNICAWEPVASLPNNKPDGAIALNVRGQACFSFNRTTGSTVDASASGIAAPSCGEGAVVDIWYTAEVPASGNLTIETFDDGYTSFDSVLTVYTSDGMGNYTEIECDDNGGSGSLSKVTIMNQTAGDILYVRIWGYNQARGSFGVCAWNATIPANNNPDNATPLSASMGSCTSNTQGSTSEATDSGIAAPSCGKGLVSDVWYAVEVPSSGNLNVEGFDTGDFLDTVLTAYTKDGSNNYTEIACDNDGEQREIICADDDMDCVEGEIERYSKLVLKGQTPGSTIYVRVWGNEYSRGDFEICTYEPASIATNDTPATATALIVGLGSCSDKAPGSTVDASASGIAAPSCGEGLTSDVWYTAKVPTSGNLTIETSDTGDFLDTVITAYTSDGMGNYTEIGCDDEGGEDSYSRLILSGQTADATLYIRVWGYEGKRGAFEVCAWEQTTATSNDTPANATALTLSTGSCENKVEGSTIDASDSGIGGAPSCGTGLNSDVWYTVVVPASGNIALTTYDIDYFNPALTVYSKDASDNYAQVGCHNEEFGGKLVVTGQTAGATLYVRAWGYGGNRGSFEICAWEPSAVPANDTPATATALIVGSGSCSAKTQGSTNDASASGIAAPSCGDEIDTDVWYSAVVPASGNLIVETYDVGDYLDAVLTVYTTDGSGNYTEIGCDDDGGEDGHAKFILTGQTPGDTLYFRVWGLEKYRGSFEICAWEPAAVAVNNTPATATALTIGLGSCSAKASGSTLDASNSGVVASSCGIDLGSDVWYTALVPASGNLHFETFNVGDAFFDTVITIYTKDSSDVFTEVGCDDDGESGSLSKLLLTDLTPGNMLYIRVWGNNHERGSFELCAWEPTAIPVNDYPAMATVLSVGSGACGDKTAGATNDASNSGVVAPSCGTDVTSDVWYSVTVPASGNIGVEATESSFSAILSAYTDDGLGNYTEVGCVVNSGDETKLILPEQTPGSTLYIRVGGNNRSRGSFEVCAWEPATIAANNNPDDAVALTIGSGACYDKVSGSTVNANNSGVTAPSCGEDIISDVWYTAVVPASGNLFVETSSVTSGFIFDTVLTAYTKDSSNVFTEVACDNDNGLGSLSKLILIGQTPGSTLYIRVSGNNHYRGSFAVCAWEPIAIPANNNPAAAVALTIGVESCSSKVPGSTTVASNSGVAAPSCGTGLSNDVWYTAVVPATGNITVETYNAGGFFSSVISAYTKDGLGNYMEIGCDDDGGVGTLSKLELTGQTAGATLYIRVWGSGGNRNVFEVCAWEHTPLSISETELAALTVYPNPTTNILHIDTQIPVESVGEAPEPQATVYSLTGAQVLAPVSLEGTNPSLDVSVLPTGIYMLHITHDKGSVYIKFVKE